MDWLRPASNVKQAMKCLPLVVLGLGGLLSGCALPPEDACAPGPYYSGPPSTVYYQADYYDYHPAPVYRPAPVYGPVAYVPPPPPPRYHHYSHPPSNNWNGHRSNQPPPSPAPAHPSTHTPPPAYNPPPANRPEPARPAKKQEPYNYMPSMRPSNPSQGNNGWNTSNGTTPTKSWSQPQSQSQGSPPQKSHKKHANPD